MTLREALKRNPYFKEDRNYTLYQMAFLLVGPKENAEIVKMISEGTISHSMGKKLYDILIESNLKTLEEEWLKLYSWSVLTK